MAELYATTLDAPQAGGRLYTLRNKVQVIIIIIIVSVDLQPARAEEAQMVLIRAFISNRSLDVVSVFNGLKERPHPEAQVMEGSKPGGCCVTLQLSPSERGGTPAGGEAAGLGEMRAVKSQAEHGFTHHKICIR